MNFRFITFITLISITFVSTAQNSPTLFSVDNNKVSLDEFNSAFSRKYGNENLSDKQAVKDFLQEYVNFKLKVEEAKSLGLNKNINIQKQIENFKSSIVQSYITDKTTLDKLANEAYQRMQTEIELLHIQLNISKFASQKDTMLAYKKAMQIRSLLSSTESYNSVAEQVSDAPFSATNKAEQGYVNIFSTPYTVENHIYNTNSSKCSYPIRSNRGYHLIQVLNKRKNPGYFKVAHILVRLSNDSNKIDAAEAKQKIDNIYKKYASGESFNLLAKQYSEDVSVDKSSALMWFSSGMMPAEFEKVCIELRNGEVSKPFKTRFGWHIVWMINQTPLPEYQQIKEQLEQKVMTSERGNIVKEQIYNKLQRKYKLKEYNTLSPIIKMVDSTIFEGRWIATGLDVFNDKLFETNKKVYYQKDFIKYLLDNQKPCFPIPLKNYVYLKYYELINNILTNNEVSSLENSNKTIANQLKNFEEVILANEIEKQKINQGMVISDLELQQFYEENKSKYNQSYQADISIFGYNANIKKIEKSFKKLKRKDASDKEIEAKIKASRDLSFSLDKHEIAEEGDNIYINHIIQLFKKGKLGYDDKLFVFANEKKIVWLNSHIEKTNKAFEQVKEKLKDDYQIKQQSTWIDKIRHKHSVLINEAVLD